MTDASPEVKLARLEARVLALETSVRDGNARIEGSVEALGHRLESWFDHYEEKRDSWRDHHEKSNSASHAALETKITAVRETLVKYTGLGLGVALLGGSVIGMFLNKQADLFASQNNAIATLQRYAEANRELIDEGRREDTDIRVYLSSGGRIPLPPQNARSSTDGQPRK